MTCQWCGAVLVRRDGEPAYGFRRRATCVRACSQQWNAKRAQENKRAAQADCGRCEDIEFLADCGEHPDTIAARVFVGSIPSQLRAQMRRHLQHNKALLKRMEAAR